MTSSSPARREQPDSSGGFVYRALVRLVRFTLFVFYRQIVVVGRENVPTDSGSSIIFAGNHQNSLIDPMVLLAVATRRVRFLAKDVLFRSALLRPILRGLGAVPVVRRVDQDGKVDPQAAAAPASVDNAAAFAAMNEALLDGGAIGIFPEGLSHDEAQLQRLKTGAARIAFSARCAHPELRLHVVPCGLNYMRPKSFRSRVLVQFGPPIELDDELMAHHAENEREAVAVLTERIDRGLRAMTINAPDWETLRLLDAARRLYQPRDASLAERVELARRFTDGYASIVDEPEVKTVLARLAEYSDRLETLGLDDRDLQRRIGRAEALGRIGRHLALGVLWLPLALPGLFVHLPVGLLARLAGQRFAPRRDVTATTKLVVGLLLSCLSYGLTVALVGGLGSLRLAILVALLLPVSGFALLVVLDRSRAVTKMLATLARLGRLDQEVAYLATERAALETEVVRLVERFRPAHLVPLFPRDEDHL